MATNYLERVPYGFVYVCRHKAVDSAGDLKDLYKKLLAHDLVIPTEAQVKLSHHCSDCLRNAFHTGASKGPGEQWGSLAMSPVYALRNSKDLNSMNISWFLMFRELWTLLTERDMQRYWLNPHDMIIHDLFYLWRKWCLLTAWYMSAETQRRFLMLIVELFGWHAGKDVEDLVELYRRQPRAVESMMPGDCHERDNMYKDSARSFHKRAGAKDLAFPADLGKEWAAVLRAASQWSAELLGPPQKHDMDEDLLARDDGEFKWGPEEHARLVHVMASLNYQAMRMKVQLYEMFEYHEPAKLIQDTSDLDKLTGLLSNFEKRADVVRPLEREKRLLWKQYVRFAKPESLRFFHGQRIVSPEKGEQARLDEPFDAPYYDQMVQERELVHQDCSVDEVDFPSTFVEHGEKS